MKARILSLILSLAVIAAVWFLIQRAMQDPVVPATEGGVETDAETQAGETTVSRAYVVETAHDAEDLVTRLAYTQNQNADSTLSDLVDRMKRSSEFLKDVEEDYYGATYFAKIAEILEDVLQNPFTDSATFSARAGKILTELENTFPPENAKEGLYYPQFNTDPNGATALALLSLYRQQVSKNTGSILLTFGGNLILGDTLLSAERPEGFKAQESAATFNYPLYGLASVLQNDAASFANLENPLTTSTDSQAVSGVYKGLPAYGALLKNSGVEVVSLANDGVKDYGNAGYSDTLKALKEAKVDYTENGSILYRTTEIGSVAYISYNIINQTGANVNLTQAPAADVAKARENGAKIVVIHFNWVNTEEKSWDPSMSQVLTARNAVDAGADLVIATHPDSMEAIERYNGVSIVYSPGTLSKNGTAPSLNMLFQQAFSLDAGGALVRGSITAFPILSSTDQNGTPHLVLDAAGAQNFLSTMQTYSNTVRYGVGKNDAFPLSDLNVIAISK